MHRCPVDPVPPDAVPVFGREAAAPAAVIGGSLLAVVFVAAALGPLRIGPAGAGAVLLACAVVLVHATVVLRPARASCSVRRAVYAAHLRIATAAVLWLALA